MRWLLAFTLVCGLSPLSHAESPALLEAYRGCVAHARAKELVQAQAQCKHAYALAQAEFGVTHEKTASLGFELGKIELERGERKQALELFRSSLGALEKSWGPNDPRLIGSNLRQAALYAQEGRPPRARTHLKKALRIIEAARGPEHLETAELLTRLGEFELGQARMIQARRYHERALKIREGHADPSAADSLYFLGKLSLVEGKYKRAERLYLDALERWQAATESDPKLIAAAHERMAYLYDEWGRPELVDRHLLQAALAAPPGPADEPVIRVDPEYPATNREGWVQLRFQITPGGHVEGASVTASEPSTVFDGAALKAIRQWRFKPSVEQGKPVARTDVERRLEFSRALAKRQRELRRLRLAGTSFQGLYNGY